jgi:hypothetical protein
VIAASLLIVACTPADGGGTTGSTTTTAPANLAHCPTPAPGQVRVAVVVDTSGLAGAGTSSVVCVVVASTATGATALAARAARLGIAAPRYNASGLLCAIDGLPAAPACGSPVGNGFAYWSYWTGGPSWTYATFGPAGHGVFEGDVEGWRWVPSGTAPAPQASPSFVTLTS